MNSYKWKNQTKKVLILSLLAGAIGSCLSMYQAYSSNQFGVVSVFNGIIDGFLIVFLLSSYTLIVADFLLKDFFKGLNFTTNVIVHSFIYVVLILIGRATGRYFMEYNEFILFPIKGEMERVHFIQATAFAIIGSIMIHFFLQINHLLGPRILVSFITGRYHSPEPEERIILFLDLTSSTRIAEELGDAKFLKFLDSFFYEFTEPILETGAEIYKYVGDEIILTWPKEKGLKNGNCIKIFKMLNERLETRKDYYENEYQNIPKYRAGVHLGMVMTGEMGDLKREIVHVGDAMNTAARLADHCRAVNESIILSKTITSQLTFTSTNFFKSLGPVKLRGKAEQMEVFTIVNL